ncbi:DUF3168 domain-containing protein [Limoniibacter endophyticus]|uniref:DUF3168 domain-containing protein n=1 Tax=Limoniibacter endophyticus TaxID=1565040 RepID=A0A8J3GFW8_9HYPH|nr:DUF3168 domain-containing protein [Limoniibacter endophyticus]GHC69317.1 hypothetical protein GCM10010136_15030 [Limoniibacter endophyticus]
MIRAATELQKAIYAALSADSTIKAELGTAIYDVPPSGAQFPYISFGQTDVADWSTASEKGSEHLFSLHIWSRDPSRECVYAIMEQVNRRLALRPELSSLRLVDLGLSYSEVRYDDDLMLYRGLMRYRALIELSD